MTVTKINTFQLPTFDNPLSEMIDVRDFLEYTEPKSLKLLPTVAQAQDYAKKRFETEEGLASNIYYAIDGKTLVFIEIERDKAPKVLWTFGQID